MNREHLTRLVETATPEQLRQIARMVLRLSGYAASRITDGPYDGGSDLRVHGADGSLLPLAIALSVERDWRKKLTEDAAKAKRKLSLTRLLFISTRRIPEGSFRPLQVKLQADLGVQVDRIDQQAITDIVLDGNRLSELLIALDISIAPGLQPSEPSDRRRDAAFAYAFFSPEVRSFRETVREKSLLIALAHAGGGVKVGNLCSDAARLLGLSVDDAPRLLPDLERLRKQGRLQGYNGSVALTPEERSTLDALRALRHREEASLRDQIAILLDSAGLATSDEILESVLRGLGALMLRHVGAANTLEDIRAQTRTLQRELEAHGLPNDRRADSLLQRLLEVARNSSLGQSLATGSLYRTLTNLNRDALLSALDARSVALVLDASVAIPMLCSLYFGEVRQRFFIVARELYGLASRHNFSLQLPEVWLEEMASHLLKARFYRGLSGASTSDLRLSENAYVAYYFSNPQQERKASAFTRFLGMLGLTEAVERRVPGDFVGARRQIEQFLRRQLTHYGVSIVETPAKGPQIVQADKDWTWARHELRIDHRDEKLEGHDKQVLAWLASIAEDDPTHVPLVVTWDRLLRRARPEGVPGGALDPLAVCELLSFVGGEQTPAETPRFAGFWLTEVEVEKGAHILDTLVQLEREGMSDAELVQLAEEFRNNYLDERGHIADTDNLQTAWRKFREHRG